MSRKCLGSVSEAHREAMTPVMKDEWPTTCRKAPRRFGERSACRGGRPRVRSGRVAGELAECLVCVSVCRTRVAASPSRLCPTHVARCGDRRPDCVFTSPTKSPTSAVLRSGVKSTASTTSRR